MLIPRLIRNVYYYFLWPASFCDPRQRLISRDAGHHSFCNLLNIIKKGRSNFKISY